MNVLIVGAGIIGAALAFRLARFGAEVTVVEAASPAQAASGRSFGWINASFYLSPLHHRLRVEAIAAHHRLQAELPGYRPDWQGALWWEEAGAGLEQKRAELLDLGYAVEILSQVELAKQEPALQSLPRQALRFPQEASLDAAEMTRVLLAASGARVLSGLPAKSLIQQSGKVVGVRSPVGPIHADYTLLAAGVGTPDLLATVGLDLPMLRRPGLLLRSGPVPFRLRHILVTPDQEIRQTPDGCLLAPCAARHQADDRDRIANAAAARAATLAHLSALFGKVIEAETVLGHRPVPGDGLPVLGLAAPGLGLAVMHSGITLAPFAAETLCAEITGQAVDTLWSGFRPDRLLRAM